MTGHDITLGWNASGENLLSGENRFRVKMNLAKVFLGKNRWQSAEIKTPVCPVTHTEMQAVAIILAPA